MGTEWVVYSKPVISRTQIVVEYLARYTKRIGLTNARLLKMDEDHVWITYRDYRGDGRRRVMKLEGAELLRRFMLHLLPKRFMRVRYYGYLANVHRRRKLAQIRQALRVGKVQKAAEATTSRIGKTMGLFLVRLFPRIGTKGKPIADGGADDRCHGVFGIGLQIQVCRLRIANQVTGFLEVSARSRRQVCEIILGKGCHWLHGCCKGNQYTTVLLRITSARIVKGGKTSARNAVGPRFDNIQVVGEPKRIPSTFVSRYSELPVVLHGKA